jgi:hypothetical protein
MVGTQPDTGARIEPETAQRDWRKRMSNQVAYALLVYTGLQIFLTMGALHSGRGSLLPYVALVVLVGAIIPACRGCDRHWQVLDETAAHDPEMAASYRRDCRALWALALGLPLAMTLLLKLLAIAFTR